ATPWPANGAPWRSLPASCWSSRAGTDGPAEKTPAAGLSQALRRVLPSASQIRVFVFRLQPSPAAFDFFLEGLEDAGVFRFRQMAGFAHHLQPFADRNALVFLFRIVGDV